MYRCSLRHETKDVDSLMDLVIQICKLGGVIWTASFGVMALLTTFRDERTQRVTRWGRIALVGIALSTVLAVGAQLLEYSRERRGQEDILRDIKNVLDEIDRQNHVLTDVEITVALRFSKDHPIIEDYRDSILSLFDTIRKEYRAKGHWFDLDHSYVNVVGHSGSEGHQVDRIWMSVPQDLFPKDAIRVSLGFGVYSASVAVTDIELRRSSSADGPSPDVDFALYSGRLEAGRLHYFPNRESFVFEFRQAPVSLRTTPSSMSIRDLRGKLLAVGVLSYETISLEGVQFKLPSGVSVVIGRGAFEATSQTWPDVSFYTIVPNLEQMGQWPVDSILP